MATGLSLSSTSNLTNGQRIMIASAKEAFEPAAPDPDLIENERIPTGVKQWDISTYARLTDAQALTASAAGGTGSYTYSWSVIRPDASTSTSEFSNFSSASSGELSQSCFFTVGYAGHNLVRCLITDVSS